MKPEASKMELDALLYDIRSYLNDHGDAAQLLSRVDLFRRQMLMMNQRITWTTHPEDRRRERAKFRNFKMFVWVEDACSNVYFRYLITKNDELIRMVDCKSRDQAKKEAETFVLGEYHDT